MGNWSRQHSVVRERILPLMSERAVPFEDRSAEAAGQRRSLPFLEWCRTYLPHYFDRPFAPFHGRMVRAVGEAGLPTFVGAFRGAGKSVLLALARPLRRLLHGECPYLIFGSQVQRLAAESMDYVRLELEHNGRIRGDYAAPQVEGSETRWTVRLPLPWPDHPPGVAGSRFASARLEAFGIGMSPRGRRYRQWRPGEFIGDDLENAELARSPVREQNLWDWMMDEVVPAMEPGDHVFTVLGTMFGPGCMLERARSLAAQEDSSGRPLARLFLQRATSGARTRQPLHGASVWPERFPDELLARIRRTIGLRNWLRNYALVAEDPTRPFQPAWMGAYDPAELDVGALDVVCFLDPAVSESPTSCPRALVAVGCDRSTGTRYVLDAWIERGSPMAMVDKLIEFHRRLRPRLVGIEQNGGYALVRPLLQMRPGGAAVPARYVTHTRSKAIRIESLSAQFEVGRWLFPRNPNAGIRTLQEQFLSYPEGFVDGPDACAGCDDLLPGGPGAAPEFEYRTLGRRTDFREV